MGFSHLLSLRDAITVLNASRVTEVSQPVVAEHEILSLTSTSRPTVAAQQGSVGGNTADTFPVDSADPQAVEHKTLMANYEALGRKLAEFKATPTAQHIPTSTATQSPHHKTVSSAQSHPTSDPTHCRPDNMASLRNFSFLQRKEFEVHGGEVGDSASDISYHGLCKQINEGLKAKHTEGEVIQGVLCIIKPGQFKDMLINKDNLTISGLKSFMCSHLSEKSGSELFQEFMSTKQHEHESPQQFLYRMIGLKQKVMFASRHYMDIEYEPCTIQNVFLHTIHQGLLPKCSDVRSELKPLLSDYTVSDEALIRQVNNVSSEESEKQQRLGHCSCQKVTQAHSTQLKLDNDIEESSDCKAKKSNITEELSAKLNALTKVVESLTAIRTSAQVCQCIHTKSKPKPTAKQCGCPKCVCPCSHCFICGETGHRAVGCLQRGQVKNTSQPSADAHSLSSFAPQSYTSNQNYLPKLTV